MQLSIDLTGRDVLVAGSATAARQAVRRYEAAGAVVHCLETPHSATLTRLPEELFLVAAVADGQPGWGTHRRGRQGTPGRRRGLL